MPLTDIAIKQALPKEKPYRLTNSHGLALLVHPNGSRYWQLRYRYAGKEKLLALGVYPEVKLPEARRRTMEARLRLANGEDPGATRKKARLAQQVSAQNTFEALATEWWENKRDQWVDHHAARVIGYLRKDLFPYLGNRPIAEIEPPEILNAIRKIEQRGALDVASRSLQFCKSVYRYAIQTGRARINPAAELAGALKSRKQQHRPSLRVGDLPDFYARLRESPSEPATKLAIRLTILTFLRPGEIRTARWQDFDHDQKLWRVPGHLMKMKTEHLVPLSRQVLALLDERRRMMQWWAVNTKSITVQEPPAWVGDKACRLSSGHL